MLLQRLKTPYERGFTEHCRSLELGPKAPKESTLVPKAIGLLVLSQRVHSFIRQKVRSLGIWAEGDKACL